MNKIFSLDEKKRIYLDYLYHNKTQYSIAKEYDVSTTTISSAIKDISNDCYNFCSRFLEQNKPNNNININTLCDKSKLHEIRVLIYIDKVSVYDICKKYNTNRDFVINIIKRLKRQSLKIKNR